MKIIHLSEIKNILSRIDLLPMIEFGYAALSRGDAVVPPVGELLFEEPPGDVHIKYGYIRGEESYVIKIAAGFYDNPKYQLSSSQGLMLVFSQATGVLQAILLDEGHLTDVRTAVGGAIAAKYLAPKKVVRIGIIGTGIQAKLQLFYLQKVTNCKNVIVYGRNKEKLNEFQVAAENIGFNVEVASTVADLAATSNLIVTTTPSKIPLLFSHHIQKGTHITAVGADTADKQELDADLLASADIVVTDSKTQSQERGDIHHALKQHKLKINDVVELGDIILNQQAGRLNEAQITIADLTGVATQDIQIAKAICNDGIDCL